MIESLGAAITNFFYTATSAPMTTLREACSSIWELTAPPSTPYPVCIFELIQTNNSASTFCSDVIVTPVDFHLYSPSKETAMELAYAARKAYTDQLLSLSGGNVVVGALYDGGITTFDTLDSVYQSTVSINYLIQSPVENFEPVPYSPAIGAAVTTLSGQWSTVFVDFELPDPAGYLADPAEPSPVGRLLARNMRLVGGVSKALEANDANSVLLYIMKNSTVVGTITYNLGQTEGVVELTPTDFAVGDVVAIAIEPLSVVDGLYMVDISLQFEILSS
jgi:hypothetical protein